MGLLDYQRTVIGYHGCDRELADMVLAGVSSVGFSENVYDWLGKGIYFWEYGPRRGLEWAMEGAKKSGKIKTPAVLGAFINLGNCFDLLDSKYTKVLSDFYPFFEKAWRDQNKVLPTNRTPGRTGSNDHVLRHLDCAMVNWSLDRLMIQKSPFQTVRSVFTEGAAAFPGSKIMAKSHIQIAVRDPGCILQGQFAAQVKALS